MKSTNLFGKNNKNKITKIAGTLAAVYIYIYIVYCHLVNNACQKVADKLKLNRVIKGRTMPIFIGGTGLSFVALENDGIDSIEAVASGLKVQNILFVRNLNCESYEGGVR